MDALIEIGGIPLAGTSAIQAWSRKKFRSVQQVKTACSTILLNLTVNGLQHISEKCIACQRRHFEKQTSPHLHKAPTLSNRMSPRTFQAALLYTRRFGSWLCSRSQVTGYHHTDEFLLLYLILAAMSWIELRTLWILDLYVNHYTIGTTFVEISGHLDGMGDLLDTHGIEVCVGHRAMLTVNIHSGNRTHVVLFTIIHFTDWPVTAILPSTTDCDTCASFNTATVAKHCPIYRVQYCFKRGHLIQVTYFGINICYNTLTSKCIVNKCYL